MFNANDIADALAHAVGENDEAATVTHFLSTGYPELDYALSNMWDAGIAGGRMIEISGPPSAGKTAIATSIMAHAQRMGGIAGFMDHERSFSMKLAENLGLNTKPGYLTYKKPRTFEQSISICIEAAKIIRTKKLIDPKAPIVWVFDSLAAMVPQSALIDAKTGKDKEAEDRNMNDNTALARATSAHFPALAQHADEFGICMIFLNQIRIDLKVLYGDNRKTAGGDNSKFYFSQRIMLAASKITKSATDKEVVGTQISAVIIKNKVARPFRTATWRFEFLEDGTGRFNTYRSLIDFLVKQKILGSSAGYVAWEGGKSYPGPLAAKLEKENAWDKLIALLPKGYEPEVVAEIEPEVAA